MTDPSLYPCFLGPYAENDALLEKLVVEFLRDHVYWRRNFHPEDPPAIPTHAVSQPAYQAFEARLRRELHTLSAALKRSVPFHSPRYLGHMVSDLLLPGLAAQMLTLPYNPNNVNDDAAPVTVDLEIKVGLQLARLVGYPHDPTRPECAFGHLTSGGTLANVQALRLALALKGFAVALRAAAPPGLPVPEDDWQAFNLTPRASIELLAQWDRWLVAQSPRERRHWTAAVEAQRLETLGHCEFFARHPQFQPPVVLAPASAHYSWPKSLRLLGLGANQLVSVRQRDMRIDVGDLHHQLQQLQAARRPVLMAVGVLGTTEFGAIDPIDALVAARDCYGSQGFGFSVHVDAAWGGYIASLAREPDGTLRSREAIAAAFERFPSPKVHAAIAALADTDSITIDPHKLGYVAYGAGAFVCRDHRAMSLLAVEADYVFTSAAADDYFTRYRQLGRYIPEGSKPGAMAAAVYVTHRVLPLDHEHFGKLIEQSLRAVEAFVARAERFRSDCADLLYACLPFQPDTNLVCLALNPRGNATISGMNEFVQRLQQETRIDASQPLQLREFFGSTTLLRTDVLGREATVQLLGQLGLSEEAGDPEQGVQKLLILRHTIMNPFLLDEENGISYIDRYFEFLTRRVRTLCESSYVREFPRNARSGGRAPGAHALTEPP